MNMLQGSKTDGDNHTYQYCRVINRIPFCLSVLKRMEKFHEATSHEARYKTALPFLEMHCLQDNTHTIITKLSYTMSLEV